VPGRDSAGQVAALKPWNPANQPEWLDEKYYCEKKIRLRTIQVPAIQSQISVSEPYALRIRNGKCIPHPRHWLALEMLTNLPFPVDPKSAGI
jgi:hypothetical protein